MKAKILQCIIEDGDELLVFTENPEVDIHEFIQMYEDENATIHLGYEKPTLYTYTFLGKEYRCIMLWYDHADDIAQTMSLKLIN